MSSEGLPLTLVKSRKGSGASPERFSLLLLEFGEIYFEDFSAIFYPNADSEQECIERKQRGRLKICSQSVLFDPLDFSDPVIKINYRDCVKIDMWSPLPGSIISGNSFVVEALQVTEMLEGNVFAPYKFVKGNRRYLFSLKYGNINALLSQILTLHRATKLPTTDQHSLIESIVLGRRSAVSFNTSWLEDIYEEHVVELTGERVTPLVSNPGRIMLTSSRLYFQPFNNAEPEPVLKVKLSGLQYVMKRRYMLRHVGLELFCGSGYSMFLALPSPRERNHLYDRLLCQPNVRLKSADLENLTHQWQCGQLSNFDYLMFLNFLSDRSFNDIMQYPVMPWVISDYTSDNLDLSDPATFRDLKKPIGALNEERLQFYKDRYADMSSKPFLYGTHYSAPGYVLYYLVRAAPEYLLCLQTGRFDQPNRLFHSIAKTWENVNTDHADVKELIPEFYLPPGDFLKNIMSLDLGVRTDSVRVNDTVLPPWATSAEEFTRRCREALEGEFVSRNLHHWVDLIFGCKQQGRAAVLADNVFHYLTYEGACNLDYVHDPEQLAAMELQIKEFGQTPKRLFTRPHPSRVCWPPTVPLKMLNAAPVMATIGSLTRDGSDSEEGEASPVLKTTALARGNIKMDGVVRPGGSSADAVQTSRLRDSVPDTVKTAGLSTDGLGSVGSRTFVGSGEEGEVGGVRGARGEEEEVGSGGVDEGWVNVEMPPVEGQDKGPKITTLKLVRIQKTHKEPISAVKLSHDGETLFSVSHDKTLKALQMEDCAILRSSAVSNLPLSCIAVLPESKTVLVGSWDNQVHVYSVDFASVVCSSYCHDSSVTALCWKADTLATGSWDSTVKIWCFPFDPSQHKPEPPELQCELDHDNEVSCLDLNSAATKVVSGTVDGYVTVWSIADELREFELQAHTEAVHAVELSPGGERLCTCGGDRVVRVLDLASHSELISRKTPDTFFCAAWNGNLILLGSEIGELHVWESATLTEVTRLKGHSGVITSIAVSADGRTIVSGSRDKYIAVWSLS